MGSGLGMSVASSIAEKLGMDLGIKSSGNSGTIVTLVIPTNSIIKTKLYTKINQDSDYNNNFAIYNDVYDNFFIGDKDNNSIVSNNSSPNIYHKKKKCSYWKTEIDDNSNENNIKNSNEAVNGSKEDNGSTINNVNNVNNVENLNSNYNKTIDTNNKQKRNRVLEVIKALRV